MKIVCDATALYGRFGGIENALWHTVSGLAKLDACNDYLVCVPFDAPAPPESFNSNWKWRRLPFRGAQKMRRIAWQQLELPLLLCRERADVLWAPTYVAPLATPIPVVLGAPDLIALDRPRFATRANRMHYRAMMPRALRRAARVIVTTSRVRDDVLRRLPNSLVRVVPLGVERLFFNAVSDAQIAELRVRYELPTRFLLYVGNFEPKKNLPNLLAALRLLPHAPPLVIAGGIKAWPGFEPLLRDVHKLGFIPRADLPALYAACEAFCFPSMCEGFGLPVLESLALGAPTLASTQVPPPNLERVAAMPHPRFPRSIAMHLDALLQAPRTREAADARRAYAREFTWNRTANLTLAVFEELNR